jgi:hypothetical protein
VADELAKLLHFFLVAAGAKIALLATEGYKVIVPAMVAMESGKALAKVATFHEAGHGAFNNRAQVPVLGFEARGILFNERLAVIGKALPERRSAGPSRAVEGKGQEYYT